MRILFISLGCDKNLVDSERMLGLLGKKGYDFTGDREEADAVIINSCCFIGDAKEESINTILDFARDRTEGRLRALIVCGCLAQRYSGEIRTQIPEVDAVVGTSAIDRIVEVLESVLAGNAQNALFDIDRPCVYDTPRSVTTGGHFAYLKIAEGCDKRCTYCVIPRVRGRYRSVPMEALVREAETLAEGGVKELILVAQETTLYGIDLYGKKMLPELLRGLAKVEGIVWIRLLYCYPEEITDELIETIREEHKICHYLDIPIQHASDAILKKMGRLTRQEEIRERIRRIRERIPDICLRTTFITGFPGESEEDFGELMDFVDEMEFDRLGVFPYSQEEDTPAAGMSGQIPEETKEERRDALMELQQEIAFEKEAAMVGRTMTAMVEGKLAEENVYVARTWRDAPDVDGYLFLDSGRELNTGDFVQVRITGSHEYDLTGELEDEFTE